MRFVLGTPTKAVPAVVKTLSAELQSGKQVVWLVCGGSNIPAEAKIMGQLVKRIPTKLKQLTVLPMDERYGSPGHKDSNFKQLQKAGFHPGSANWYDVLAKNLPLEQTVEYYTHLVEDAFATADTIVGLFGLGPDAHTAGVLPGSPAAHDEPVTVVGYDSPPFVRMTLTPHELIKTNIAFVLAYGAGKKQALERLQQNQERLAELPASLLYEIPEVTVYNDRIESAT
jgi:6-phosphogluconolactonase/glucosamine-6-phosphate isomerase/deaminase